MCTILQRQRIRQAFDSNRKYCAPENALPLDDEYSVALQKFDGKGWNDVRTSDLLSGYPAFSLMPDAAFIFFFPTMLDGLCIPEGEKNDGDPLPWLKRLDRILRRESSGFKVEISPLQGRVAVDVLIDWRNELTSRARAHRKLASSLIQLLVFYAS